MNSPKILAFGLLAVVTLFSIVAVTPGAINVSSTIQQVNAVESGDGDRENVYLLRRLSFLIVNLQ